MSTWKTVKKEDIELSQDGETIEVYIDCDKFGNNYIEISKQDILDLFDDQCGVKNEAI